MQHTRVIAATGTLFLGAQALMSLAFPPHGSGQFSGSAADIANDSVFAVGLAFSAASWVLLVSTGRPVARAWVNGALALGATGMIAAIVATIAAGHEVWSASFVVGFALIELGLLATPLPLGLSRAWPLLLCIPGLVLALAFFASGGAAGLAAGMLVVTARFNTTTRDLPPVNA